MHAIELVGVRKRLGGTRRSLPQVHIALPTLSVDVGDCVAIVGKSGSGKSTLVHLVAGLLQPDSGTVAVAGQLISRLSRRELDRFRGANIGLVFQEFNLSASLTALENVQLASRLSRAVPPGEWKARSLAALERVGLADRRFHLPHELSAGERQRIAVARATVHHPKLLLADEPTGSLDADNGQRVMTALMNARQEVGGTLLVITHDPAIAGMCPLRIEASGWITAGDTQRQVTE